MGADKFECRRGFSGDASTWKSSSDSEKAAWVKSNNSARSNTSNKETWEMRFMFSSVGETQRILYRIMNLD
jgi:hypothetical protein